jgi:WW domain-containing oxidoreductase
MRFSAQTTAAEVVTDLELSTATFLVTGATSGIGLETARVLAARGAHVVGTGRTLEGTQAALDGIAGAGGITAVACELSEPASVRAAVAAVVGTGRRLDAIVANAGIMALPTLTTKHGLELQFLTNHVGHFMLVTGLIEQLAPHGRVVMVSSMAHLNAPPSGVDFDNLDGSKGYSPFRAYGQSKVANILFANALAQRFGSSGRVANSLHPGVIKTNLTRHMPDRGEGIFVRLGEAGMKSIAQGAATQTLLAVHPSTATVNGTYWSDCQPGEKSVPARDAALAERLWTETEAIVRRL